MSGRKLLFFETARNVESFGRAAKSDFPRGDGKITEILRRLATPPLSELTRCVGVGGFQAANCTASARVRSRANNSRPIWCKL